MTNRTAFHLDCTPVLTECGYKCGKCLDEMKSVFGKMPGVSKFYREDPGVVVEHDAGKVTAAQLLDIFRGLPSFYAGRFIPTVMENPRSQG